LNALQDDDKAVYDLVNGDNVHWRFNVAKNRIELTGTEHQLNRLNSHLSFENHPDPDQAEVFPSENLNYGHYQGREPPAGWGCPSIQLWNRQDLQGGN
jgi:hypothetical protein